MSAGSEKRAKESGSEPVSLQPSQENYLLALYRLSGARPVQIKALAEHLGLRRPSVSRAVAELVRLGLVVHPNYGGVALTPEGRALGAQLARRAACLERLLSELLGLSPEEAVSEADRLEHAVSARLLARLETLTDFALSSAPWVRRLAFRLQRSGDGEMLGYRFGETPMHAGGTPATPPRRAAGKGDAAQRPARSRTVSPG